MAFASWESAIGTPFTSGSTSHDVDMPATVNAGDLLVLFVAGRTTAANPQTPSGWTNLQPSTDVGTFDGLVAAKVAAGTEGGGTVTVTFGNSRNGSAQIVRISGWLEDIAGVEEGGNATGASASPDAGSFSPSWGAEDTLWLWYALAADDDQEVTSAPSGYSNLTSTSTGSGVNASTTCATATRTNNASSEDPGAGTIDSSADWLTGVIAVRPAAAGGGSPGESRVITTKLNDIA